MSEKDSGKQTLVSLTKDFIKLMAESNGTMVEISKAESILCANKRRLYDVTNVLTGIGLIERCGKSMIKWVGRNDTKLHDQLVQEEEELDLMTNMIDQYMRSMVLSQEFQENAWITAEDISMLDAEQQLSLFAIRGPPSMTMQIDENDEHHLICETDKGQIELIPIHSTQ